MRRPWRVSRRAPSSTSITEDCFAGPGPLGEGPGVRGLRVPVPQSADGAVPCRGRRARRHGRRALRVDRAGSRLGRHRRPSRCSGRSRPPTPRPPCSRPLPEMVWIGSSTGSAAPALFSARDSDIRIELPMDPMHGTVGVAPANLEVRSALVPDAHGGNMDTPEMRAGVTCYLGVNVEGALLSLGDGHARQGEGETCGVAVECAMNTVVIVELLKGVATPWPRIESDSAHHLDGLRAPARRTRSGSRSSTWSSGWPGTTDFTARRVPVRRPRPSRLRSPTSATPTTPASPRSARNGCRQETLMAASTVICGRSPPYCPASDTPHQERPHGP